MATVIYNHFLYRQLGDTGIFPLNLKTSTLKLSLHTSSYTPDIDSHTFLSDLTNEVSGGGYARKTLSVTTSQDNTNDRGKVVVGDISWTPFVSFTARYAAIWRDTGVASTSHLILLIDFGEDKQVIDGDFDITFDATNGLLTFAKA